MPMTMGDWAIQLDKLLELDARDILKDAGKITAKIAKDHAENEFEKFRIIQDQLFESDFDKEVKAITEHNNTVPKENTHEDLLNTKNDDKSHPWRRCSIGKHFVKEHILHDNTKVREHCAFNPSHKEELSYDEIQYITKKYFNDLPGPPTAGVLKFADADTYDCYIRGWTYFWNDIFKPTNLLDANYIKALIATESGFRKNPPENPHAHGLMQLLHQTFTVLQDVKGELHDHLIRISWERLLDPTTNICMGIRWLFQKRYLLSVRLKREVTWEEAVIEYKSYWDHIRQHGEMPKGIRDLREYYKNLLAG